MSAYYNEIDPYAAEWLRNLIIAGRIAPGHVDERSIEDVRPDDLRGYTQCHFFAGVGVWSHALRGAGWPDNKPVWTGSCPCQPFSAAGKGAGFTDERHLWPAWYHLITQCEPGVVFGEQVASKDGLGWLDLVQADLEAAGYASGALDLCSAGVGAPHIRQRSWFVAERLADSATAGLGIDRRGGLYSEGETGPHVDNVLEVSGMAHPHDATRKFGELGSGGEGAKPGACRGLPVPDGTGASSGLADSDGNRCSSWGKTSEAAGYGGTPGATGGDAGHGQPRPTNGLWGAADWLYCRDGKWRPVEPGTFPLANGASSRVGRLRAYGNAINAKAAEEFIRAYGA